MIIKECKFCKKEFVAKRNRQVFCCIGCGTTHNNMLKGEKQSELVGEGTRGLYRSEPVDSILNLSLRTAQKIIKRLKLGCSNCGWDNTSCDIHHINGRNVENADNHNNLSLLCPNCHRMVHEGKLEKEKLVTLEEFLPDDWQKYYYG